MMEEERMLSSSSASNSRAMNIENQPDQQQLGEASQHASPQKEQIVQNEEAGEKVVQGYWQSKKVEYLSEMCRLLSQGVERGEELVQQMPDEFLATKIEEAKAVLDDESRSEQWEEQEKKIVRECCLWLVEEKSGSEYDLIKLSTLLKEYAGKIMSGISSLSQKSIDFFRNIIAENSEKKYYGIKLTKDIKDALQKHQNSNALTPEDQQQALRVGLHEVWEIKEMQLLCFCAKIEELEFLRKKRRHHSALLRCLEKLIKAIEKEKGEDEAFGAYQKTITNPPKIRIQSRLGGNQRKVANSVDKSIEDNLKKMKVDKSIEENLKKMKIDSGNNTPVEQQGEIKNEPEENASPEVLKSKKRVSKKRTATAKKEVVLLEDNCAEQQDINLTSIVVPPQDQSMQNSSNPNPNPESSKTLSQKKNQSDSKKTTQPVLVATATQPLAVKDTGQKKILSFFKKNPIIAACEDSQQAKTSDGKEVSMGQHDNCLSENNPEMAQLCENKQVEIMQPVKSIFRKIGGADPRAAYLQTSEKIRDVKDGDQVFEILKEECKLQWGLLRKRKFKMQKGTFPIRKRRILVVIHDYVRQFKNVWVDMRSKKISPKDFLKKDEDQIQYDLDSEDELQELNAENIDNEEDDIDEEDGDNDDESAKHFIVPDGYLSDEGFDSDKEDVFDQKKLNFHNYNFAENANKQGFIFQERDKAPDVQNFLANYRVKRFDEALAYPLSLVKHAPQTSATGEENIVVVPEVWTNERMKAYIRIVHGSYQPKKALLDVISKMDIMKDVSKNRLEKKFKEITQKDEKIEGEGLRRWLVHSAVLESLEFEENEIEDIKKMRQEEYKSSRPKKEEKVPLQVAGSSQSAPSSVPPLSVIQPIQLPKPVIGFNIFSSCPPLKKNVNITPIKSATQNQDEEEMKELEEAQKKQDLRLFKENENQILPNGIKQVEFYQQKEQDEAVDHQQDLIANELSALDEGQMIDECSINIMIRQMDQKGSSRKCSASLNENSNASMKRNCMKQTTLSFLHKNTQNS